MSTVLILGSGPNAVQARDLDRDSFDHIVVINNAWQVRDDWTHVIYPEDFPTDRRPPNLTNGQSRVEADAFVPAQNAFGGFVYAGGTMAFTAGYWALHALRPSVMAFLGCDMVYAATGHTHFYGTGTADPLRDDITLRSLEAKSARLMACAADMACAVVNLSTAPSRLVFPRATAADLTTPPEVLLNQNAIQQARTTEADLAYSVPSGRYWLHQDQFDIDQIDRLDALWLNTVA